MKEITLNNDFVIPCIGYGTYKDPDDRSGVEAILTAFDAGYRLIDTAAAYGNERAVGQAVAESGICRDEIIVTSKVNNPDRGYDSTLRAFEASLNRLGLDYMDLYLVHWPASGARFDDWQQINSATWKAMERLYDEGAVKAIGVSNFLTHYMEALCVRANVLPAVNQIEFHPGFMQRPDLERCQEHGIVVEGWSPLGRMRLSGNPLLNRIAESKGVTTAQVCLRWAIQHRVVPLPKSMNGERIRENIDIFGFSLSEEEMKEIDSMPETGASGLHPDTIDF